MCSYKASPWLPYIHVIRNVHICMHLPRFHQQDTSCLSLIHSPWNVIRVRIISDLIAQMSNPCLFLSGKQNDTTRQLFSRCAASLNEQCTTDLIGCNSLIPRPPLLGESHSQTSITGRVSFPDLHCWESLIPRPSVQCTLEVKGLWSRLSSSRYTEHACCFSSRLASVSFPGSHTGTRIQTRAWEWGYLALSLSTVTDKRKGWQSQAILFC